MSLPRHYKMGSPGLYSEMGWWEAKGSCWACCSMSTMQYRIYYSLSKHGWIFYTHYTHMHTCTHARTHARTHTQQQTNRHTYMHPQNVTTTVIDIDGFRTLSKREGRGIIITPQAKNLKKNQILQSVKTIRNRFNSP